MVRKESTVNRTEINLAIGSFGQVTLRRQFFGSFDALRNCVARHGTIGGLYGVTTAALGSACSIEYFLYRK